MLPSHAARGVRGSCRALAKRIRPARLEQQLNSYRRLQVQALDALRREFSEVKDRMLSLAAASFVTGPEDAPG